MTTKKTLFNEMAKILINYELLQELDFRSVPKWIQLPGYALTEALLLNLS